METKLGKLDFGEMVRAAEQEANRKIRVIRTSKNSYQLVWAEGE